MMADDRACLAGNASGSRSGSASLRDGGVLLLKAIPCNIITIMLNSPNKGGTTGGGFLLSLYRITFECQDFPSPSTCLDLPRLA